MIGLVHIVEGWRMDTDLPSSQHVLGRSNMKGGGNLRGGEREGRNAPKVGTASKARSAAERRSSCLNNMVSVKTGGSK